MKTPRLSTKPTIFLSGENESPSAKKLSVIVLGTCIALAGCTSSSDWNEICAETYERAVLEADMVVSAQFECGGSFGSATETGTVTLAVSTQKDATSVIEEVYRSLAADSGLRDTKAPSIEFVSENGETRFDIDDLGFSGSPSVDQLREKYGITPTPTP